MTDAAATPVVRLLSATVEHLEARRDDPESFAALVGSAVPDGWPEFGEMVDFTVRRLTEHPDEARWWTQFFFDADGKLIGSGGFVGPPVDRTVEIGYEIAPAYRGRRYGVGAAHALVVTAAATGEVDTVIAHTLAELNPSSRVLRGLGFVNTGEITHPDAGLLWRWELSDLSALVAPEQLP